VLNGVVHFCRDATGVLPLGTYEILYPKSDLEHAMHGELFLAGNDMTSVGEPPMFYAYVLL